MRHEDEGFYDHTSPGGWCGQCTGTGRVDNQGRAANADGPHGCPSCHGTGKVSS